jgi:hypothetical protein
MARGFCMWKAIRRFSRKSVMVAGLVVSLMPITAQATIQLETWQSYGSMAEQGAICAAFSRFIELQSLVDPRIGKLWQERHRYAGSVISKAATLEGVEELTSADINCLVDRYAAWLMTNLTEADYATMINDGAHVVATNGNIGIGGLDVAFAIPSKPSTSGYHVQIGTYRNETDAHRVHHLLEQLDHYLLDHVFFHVEPQQRRNAIYYDLVSAPPPKHHVSALCAVLCQQKMGCSASFAP